MSNELFKKSESKIHGHYWNHFIKIGSALVDVSSSLKRNDLTGALNYFKVRFMSSSPEQPFEYLEEKYTALAYDNLQSDNDKEKLEDIHTLTETLNDIVIQIMNFKLDTNNQSQLITLFTKAKQTGARILDRIHDGNHQKYFDNFTQF